MYSIVAVAFMSTQPAYIGDRLFARGGGCTSASAGSCGGRSAVRTVEVVRVRRVRAGGCNGRSAGGCTGGTGYSVPYIGPPASQQMPKQIQGAACQNCPDGVGAVVFATPGRPVLDRLFGSHNSLRARFGLRPVVLDATLTAQAQAHSELMAASGKRGCFHANPAGPGECVSWASAPGSVDHVEWLAKEPSVGHREQMLSRNVTVAGYGHATGPGGEYVTVLSK